MARTWKALLLLTVAGTIPTGSISSDGENWLQLKRLNEQSQQQLRAQQRVPPAAATQDPPPSIIDDHRAPAPQTEEQLYRQQQVQQQALQEQQRRTLISDQHRQQALDAGTTHIDGDHIQQQQFKMQQQNQLRGFRLQQQIQRGIMK